PKASAVSMNTKGKGARMDRLSVSGGGLGARRWRLVLGALIATLSLGANPAPPASPQGGGPIGESRGAPRPRNRQLVHPAMFGADSTDGTVYVGDYNGTVSTEASNYRIQQLSASGEFKASAEIKRFPVSKKIIGLQGIAVDHSLGRIYMVESCRVS